jgi:phosphoglycolate phosphatase
LTFRPKSLTLPCMKFDAIIFDLDGTLLDTLADLASAMNTALAASGYPVHPEAAYKLFVGGGVEELGKMALPAAAGTEKNIRDIVAMMQKEYRGAWAVKTRPYPGVPEMLGELAGLGVKLAVLSNKNHDFAVEMTRFYFPEIPFYPVIGANGRFPVKPDPAGALEIAREIRVNPGRCMFVGDSGSDMVTARRAGMKAVGVLWGFRSRSELSEAGAEYLFENAQSITDLILSIN